MSAISATAAPPSFQFLPRVVSDKNRKDVKQLEDTKRQTAFQEDIKTQIRAVQVKVAESKRMFPNRPMSAIAKSIAATATASASASVPSVTPSTPASFFNELAELEFNFTTGMSPFQRLFDYLDKMFVGRLPGAPLFSIVVVREWLNTQDARFLLPISKYEKALKVMHPQVAHRWDFWTHVLFNTTQPLVDLVGLATKIKADVIRELETKWDPKKYPIEEDPYNESGDENAVVIVIKQPDAKLFLEQIQKTKSEWSGRFNRYYAMFEANACADLPLGYFIKFFNSFIIRHYLLSGSIDLAFEYTRHIMRLMFRSEAGEQKSQLWESNWKHYLIPLIPEDLLVSRRNSIVQNADALNQLNVLITTTAFIEHMLEIYSTFLAVNIFSPVVISGQQRTFDERFGDDFKSVRSLFCADQPSRRDVPAVQTPILWPLANRAVNRIDFGVLVPARFIAKQLPQQPAQPQPDINWADIPALSGDYMTDEKSGGAKRHHLVRLKIKFLN